MMHATTFRVASFMLCLMIVGTPATASEQAVDRTFYTGILLGRVLMDDARDTVGNDSQVQWVIGWRPRPTWSVELAYDASDAPIDPRIVDRFIGGATANNWSMQGISLNLRWYPSARTTRPFVLLGVGHMEHGSIFENGDNLTWTIGTGFEHRLSDRWTFRVQGLLRTDYDTTTFADRDRYTDLQIHAGLLFGLGRR